MKLRYYMRGLGIGILVTAILMSVTIHGKTEKLTDEEIIERAKELGMEEKYDSSVLSETVSDNETKAEAVSDNETKAEAVSDNGTKAEAADPQTTDPVGTGPEQPEPETTRSGIRQQESRQPEESRSEKQEEAATSLPEQPDSTQTVQITVQGGDGSMSVSRKLKEAGLIEDVLSYDRFLCSNGYDRRICAGTHSFPIGASEEEIAKILTTRVN